MNEAAVLIQYSWRDHACQTRAAKVLMATLARGAEEQAERRRIREAEQFKYTLPGALARECEWHWVWEKGGPGAPPAGGPAPTPPPAPAIPQ